MASPYFVQPYQRILILMREESLPGEFQSSLHYAMRAAIIPLLEFSKRCPTCQCCQKQLEKMKDWLLQPHAYTAFLGGKESCQPIPRKTQAPVHHTVH
ncbi:hypothetical protein [Endozoicomonas numazuensis]|uniref:Uncharacterized protein n=1 Tax=Endozoicomonas numazuensis TaxID=1137799 RepID=A0A081NJ06_9GAMM|nr:hypothetical protein [Endozoicomonas numazuensis]KEQ18429.1 hypothetical protein GZ78_13095 [Endozoicomonas numazuensis]